MRFRATLVVFLIALAVSAGLWLEAFEGRSHGKLRVAISPYQDLAMLINIDHLGLEKKYGTEVNILTLPWEETYPTILSASSAVDVAFSSFADYLAKRDKVNAGSSDPLLFIYPAYVFRGGAFVSFLDDPVTLRHTDLSDRKRVNSFLDQSIALQKSTLYEMIILHLASQVDRSRSSLKIVDVGFDAGFLAAVNRNVAVAAVGLTQLTEAKKLGGRMVLSMDELGFADITGFITKQSTLNARREDIENLIRMWFDSVRFVTTDIDNNSKWSLEYLEKRAATRYSIGSFKNALSQEYFPKDLAEAHDQIIANSAPYSADRICLIMQDFLVQTSIITHDSPCPSFISIGG